jgi:hypothetical protein
MHRRPSSGVVAVCVSAFALPDPGKDAVLFVNLAPGPYTAKAVHLFQPDGVALLEVYAVP